MRFAALAALLVQQVDKPVPFEEQGRVVCLIEEMKERYQAQAAPGHDHLAGFRVEDKAAAGGARYYALFRNAGSVGWIGTVIVVQNIVSSMFNSHISDFTQGWLYVFGVGVVGGTILRPRMSANASGSQRREEIELLRS